MRMLRNIWRSQLFRDSALGLGKALLWISKSTLLLGSTLVAMILFGIPLAEATLNYLLGTASQESKVILAIVFGLCYFMAVQRVLFPNRARYTVSSSVASMTTALPIYSAARREVNRDVARHEAAHLVTALYFEEEVSEASIIGSGDTRGHVSIPSWNTGDHSFERSVERVWGTLVIRLAGTVCDQMDGKYDFGAVSDLKEADKLLPVLMAGRYGAGADGFPLSSNEIYGRALDYAKRFLEANSAAISCAESHLLSHKKITSETEGNPFGEIRKLIVNVP